MKNFSKKKITGKNNKDYKKKSDFEYDKKNTNRLEKKEQFLNNSFKNKNVENSNKKEDTSTSSIDEDKVDDYQLTRAFDLILAINLINKKKAN